MALTDTDKAFLQHLADVDTFEEMQAMRAQKKASGAPLESTAPLPGAPPRRAAPVSEDTPVIDDTIGKVRYQGARGATQFLDDGTIIIAALENPNVTTGIHEMAHVILRYLPEETQQIIVRQLRASGHDVEIVNGE